MAKTQIAFFQVVERRLIDHGIRERDNDGRLQYTAAASFVAETYTRSRVSDVTGRSSF